MTITAIAIKAGRKLPNPVGGWYNKGDIIKTINPDNVTGIVTEGKNTRIFYRNGLHEVLINDMLSIEIEAGEEQA